VSLCVMVWFFFVLMILMALMIFGLWCCFVLYEGLMLLLRKFWFGCGWLWFFGCSFLPFFDALVLNL
jgi:hypothetical protein